MRKTMEKLTRGVMRLLVLALGLGLTATGWGANLVAEWGPGEFPVSAAGSAAATSDDGGSGLTISKNNAANVSTANGISINDYPATLIPGSGTTVKTVVVGYKVKSATTAGTIIGFGVDSNSSNLRQNLNILSDGKLCFGWGNTYDWGEKNTAKLNKNQPNDGEVHFVTFAYGGATASAAGTTTFWFDGLNKVSKAGLGGRGYYSPGDITLGGVRGPANCFSNGGIEFVYVAAYDDVLSDAEALSTYTAACASVYGASLTPAVDGSNNAVFTVTDDASYVVDSATTYNSITFDVTDGKTLRLFGATLTGSNGITVNGGTVKLLTANTQLSGALGGTGTVAYPEGTLPSGVTYGATWTGTIWVKGLQGNEARNFDSYGQGTSKVKISGITGYLDSNPTITFSRELVLDDDTYGFAMKLGNGNSPGTTDAAKNRCAIFKKLSGDGTFTAGGSTGGNGAYSWPVIRIIDSSEFTGTINCQVESGAQLGGVIFSEEDEEMPDTMYNMFNPNPKRIFVSAGCTVANGNAVTVPAGKTWVAQGGIDVRGDLIVNGTLNATIVNNTGSITVNPGATVPTQGSKRDFTGWIVADGASISITQTAAEYGKGVTTVTGVENVSSITVLDPYGEVAGTITPATSATLNTAVKTAGKACWCDWEMNGDLSNAGTDTTGLSYDSNMNAGNSFYNSQMLYTYTHPYRGVTYPSTWTAVVRCTVPKVANGAVITFGTCTGGLIGLIAGDNPEEEMKLIKTTGNSAYTTLATMPIVNGTTAQHVYVFVVENNSTIKVYCDGSEVLNQTYSAFTLGGGVQVGSVHGGINSTGITAVWKGNTYAGLTEDDLKDARIDCVRLYDYSLSAAQIAALSVEFPAVKLYRATVAANANTDWGSLTWSPSWDDGNSSSKIILTVEGDASLTLPDSITANEFVINVPAANVLTLSKASGGTTLSVTEPIEVAGGTLYFNPGISQPIGLGDLNFGGTGTVRLGNGTLVNNSISGSANVELLSGVSAIMYGGSIANPLKGAGLLDYSYGNSLPSGLSFGDWTGTVKLPGFTADALNLNSYGKSGSVVEITAVNGGWIAEAGKAVAPTLKLSGNMTIDAMSSWTYTFAEITGSGNLSFSTSANSPTVNITKVAEGYSGTISSTLSNPVTITTLDRAAETPVTAGSKLLNTSSGVQASALTLAGVATSITPVFDTDGLYVKAASVTKNDATANYDTVSAAMTAAGNDAATIKLLMPTDSAIVLAPGQTLLNGNLASGEITGPNGYEVVNNNGTYTLVDNTASTWAPGDGSDNSWNTGANWSTGYKPTQYTSVTFPANVDGWTVGIPGNAGNEKCASMTLNGDVTFQRGGGDWAKLCVYGAISGNGTLTLNQTCIENDSGSVITIPGPVAIVGSNDSAFLGANGWTIAGDLSVGGYFKTQIPITVTGNAVFAASGAKVETQSAITITGTTTLNGDFSRDTTYGDAQLTFGDVTVAASTAITGAKPTTFSGTVTLASGATLTVPTASTTVSGATFATSVADSYVKATEDGSTTIYSVAAKRTVTVSVGPHSSVSGVVNGQKFVPGDVLTITASADTYYTPALTVNGDAQTSPYELTTTDADVTVSATATRDTVAITIPSVANTTVSVDYVTGGVAANATAAGAITVDAGTSLTATWTAASGYKITAGESQTINPVAAAQTLTSPTVEEMGATVSDVAFRYGDDFATATVTATVSGDATSATLGYGGRTYNADVAAGTVTFNNVVVTRGGDIYEPKSYTITVKDGETSVLVTGGEGTAVAADFRGWIDENATSTGTTGSWETLLSLMISPCWV